MDLYVAVSNDGVMSGAEMLKELAEERVCPIMTFRENEEQIVPLFKSVDGAQKFAKRNTPRDYTIGTMKVNDEDKKLFEEKGLTIQVLEFPKKREIIVEVVHLTREVETHNKGWRRNIK